MNELLYLILTVTLTFGLAAAATWSLVTWSDKLQILDHPNDRSLHSAPTPRTGGIAIVLSIVSGCALATLHFQGADPSILWIAAGAAMIACVSFLDDCFTIRAGYRFVVHILAAVGLIVGGFLPEFLVFPGDRWAWGGVLVSVFTLCFIVWMVNLYNFMDGMDGLAGGMTVVAFGVYGFVGVIEGQFLFGMLSLAIMAAALGFLLLNFPPARIFMGDTGSSTLGFLAAAFALWADRDELIPLWVSVLLFSPFIVDATVTLLRRLLHGEKVWEAHKTHYYQQLVQAGWGHRRTVLAEYGLMLCVGFMALAALYGNVSVQWAVVGALAVVYLTAIGLVSRMSRASQGKVDGKV